MFGRYTTGPTRLRADVIIPEPSSFVNHDLHFDHAACLTNSVGHNKIRHSLPCAPSLRAVVSLISGTEITLNFGADGQVNGNSGCNTYSG